jgi:hypothetical protein
MEFYSATMKNELEMFAEKLVKLERIMLSEISQA